MYEGEDEQEGVCGDPDFLTHIPGGEACHEILREKTDDQLRVFWYPNASSSSAGISASGPTSSIQSKIKSLLLSLSFHCRVVLVQFWAPITTNSGHTVLSVFEQPFGVSKLYKRFCRYRQSCIQRASSVDDITQLGPLGKVFLQGSSQECLNIERYSIQEFPMKNQAESCGIVGYWVLPLFERDDCNWPQSCVGVLEILSFDGYTSFGLQTCVENRDFVCTRSHCEECKQFHRELLFSHYDVLAFIKLMDPVNFTEQFWWIPCICDDHGAFSKTHQHSHTLLNVSQMTTTQLFTQLPLFYWEMMGSYSKNFRCLFAQTFSVKNGKSLIGKAYSINKPCFFRDASQCDWGYPVVYSDPRPRFAIPSKFIHPELPPLILEVYLPRIPGDYEDLENVLKQLLSNYAEYVSKFDVAYELKEGKELRVVSSHSHDDNYIYFDVSRGHESMNNNNTEALSNVQVILGQNNLEQNVQKESLIVDNPQDGGETSDEFSASVSSGILNETVQLQAVTENVAGNQLLQSPVYSGDPSLDQQPIVESNVHPNTQHTAETTKTSVFLSGEREISLEMIKHYYGTKLPDVASELGVSRSTFKRRCRDLGIERWPWHKKNKVSKPNRPLDVGSEGEVDKEVTTENSMLSNPYGTIGTRNDANQISNMVVKAVYRDDAVMFHLCSNSGFEELLRELNERFKLELGSFKVKYEDKEDGDWIMITCDKDLQFHIDALKITGHTRMKLKLFPVTE